MMRRISSLAFRHAALIILVVMIATGGFAMASIAVVNQAMRATLLRTIDTDIAGLADVAASGGAPELQRRIADRIAFDPLGQDQPFYLLADKDGHRLSGNLTFDAGLTAALSQVSEIFTPGGPLLVRATRLKGDMTLVVGRSLAPAKALSRTMASYLLVGSLVTILITALLTYAISGRLERRIQKLNAAFERFGLGDLSARAEAERRSDEISQLVGHVNRHLGKAEQLVRAQRQISDDIAHELRTPLTHLDTRLLSVIGQSGDAAVNLELEKARADIRSVVSLFDALLDIALAESAGAPSSTAASVNLSELAADVAELYAASAEEAGIDFQTRISAQVSLVGEHMQLARMMANLLDNAFKYAPSGSRVRLIISPGPVIIVEDDGPGISEADHVRIFDRFHRGAAVGDGYGLGLALVKVIAMRHGLSARVEDAQPGARFVIEKATEA